ncbi:hypothetical protein [Chryseobacterium sp.]|uniref:hypothetical protein n=1 Tax=Chryseobacterium sp. TaxID=1871047 RepID=UPI00321C33DC
MHTLRVKFYTEAGVYVGVRTMVESSIQPFEGMEIFATITTDVKRPRGPFEPVNPFKIFDDEDDIIERTDRKFKGIVYDSNFNMDNNTYTVFAHAYEQ